ncbi:hypothetical protein BKA70DRAFT_1265329 [Coprinopsis sp. MPI-PUGE-AT-0042]|nr:hypothetical protein BKA70DRAFT_1265329 [Coprinopsis sp. MPI-PUGE-AT-0042]
MSLGGILAVVSVPICYLYIVSRLTTTPSLPPPNPRSVSNARIRRSVQRELEAKQRQLARKPFRLFDLPPEVRIIIIEYCADNPACFFSLVRVSKSVQDLTYKSCLPLLPVRLIEEYQVYSFDLFLDQKPSRVELVRHLWVTPLNDSYSQAAIKILQRCTNLLSLACTGRLLQDGVTSAFADHRVLHTACTQFTLLYTNDSGWMQLRNSPSAMQFFRQLHRVRFVDDRGRRMLLGAPFPFRNIKQISYAYNQNDPDGSLSRALELFEAKTTKVAVKEEKTTGSRKKRAPPPPPPEDPEPLFPSVSAVILTRERSYTTSSARIWRPNNSKVYVYEVPTHKTELDLWCDNALRIGFWKLCGGD